ncbi:DUF742 domain-containing protein [Actinokineospora sp. PR83]|uniref:DUF742 domain-containing protein n=1 Tax=Actinokineospora sp. PR83 TaxID=2884908 RepID=UPI001F2C41F3|nr:DUF742 domain-containing protein [Actinokineospora sp. PR83]MCG8916747.1 DUF742 domain-containing protein [Actinokineospora sp. PR83]
MSTGRRAAGRRELFEPDRDIDDPRDQLMGEPERRQTTMSERGWEDLSDTEFGEPPNRFDIDGFRARLFGGPSATLYGDSGVDAGIPSQSDWDSKEIPAVADLDPEPEQPDFAAPAAFTDFGARADFAGHGDFYDSAPHETGSLVRPYTKTGGRTRSDYDLAIEALVSTSDRGRVPDAAVRPEHRSICGLCLDTRSVAEVAAHLRLPLGVARVLIGDMAGMGLVSIHQSGMVVGDRPSIEFMERVLSGLRRL